MSTFPISEFQHYFNAYVIYAESEERTGNTVFNVQYNGPGNNPSSWDSNKMNQYVNAVFPNQAQYHIKMISVNQGGGGRATLGGSLAIFGSFSEDTMVHEIGHALGGLADEYFNNPSSPNPFDPISVPNLDDTDDLNNIKWKHFIGHPNYLDVAAYEGGGYTNTGIWRPEQLSIMGVGSSSNYSEHFNAVSREAIMKRIYDIKNINYSFEDFVLIDAAFLARTANKSSRKVVIQCGNTHFD